MEKNINAINTFKIKNEEVEIFDLSLDYITANFDLHLPNLENISSLEELLKFLDRKGIKNEEIYKGIKLNNDNGIHGIIEHNKLTKRVVLQLNFTGKFFKIKNSYITSKKFLNEITDKFNLLYTISRTDIKCGLRSKTNILNEATTIPDLRKNEHKIFLRGSKSNKHLKLEYSQFFNDEDNRERVTGWAYSNSRLRIKCYTKIIELRRQFKKKQISEKELSDEVIIYKGYSSELRLETTLKKEQNKITERYFICKDKKADNEFEVCKQISSYFFQNHAVKDLDKKTNTYIKTNSIWASMFFYKQRTTLKEIDTNLFKKELTFKKLVNKEEAKRDSNYYLKQYSNALLREVIESGTKDITNKLGQEFIKNVRKKILKMQLKILDEKYLNLGIKQNIIKELENHVEKITEYEKILEFHGADKKEFENGRDEKMRNKNDIEKIKNELRLLN